MSRKRGIFPEYLGDVGTEVLLQNLTNVNPYSARVDQIRETIPSGFSVTAEIEMEYYDTEEEHLAAVQRLREELSKAKDPIHFLTHRPGRLVRLVMEPKRLEEGLL